jgi:hypothetical protein
MSASKGGNSYKNMKKRIILESKSEMCKWSIEGNQNLYIEEEQTIQWPKKKVQKDKQRS